MRLDAFSDMLTSREAGAKVTDRTEKGTVTREYSKETIALACHSSPPFTLQFAQVPIWVSFLFIAFLGATIAV